MGNYQIGQRVIYRNNAGKLAIGTIVQLKEAHFIVEDSRTKARVRYTAKACDRIRKDYLAFKELEKQFFNPLPPQLP